MGINGCFGLLEIATGNMYLEPANVEKELQECEHREVEIDIVSLIALGGVEKLPTDQTSQEETVHSHSDHLQKMADLCQFRCLDFIGSSMPVQALSIKMFYIIFKSIHSNCY